MEEKEQTSISFLRKYVKVLNGIAGKLNVPTIRHTSGLTRATQLQESMKENMSEEDTELAQRAREAYISRAGAPGPEKRETEEKEKENAPKGDEVEGEHDSKQEKDKYRLRGNGFMFTYNSKRWAIENIHAVFERFLKFVITMMTLFGAKRYSASAEESLNSADIGKVHLHLYLEFPKPGIDEAVDERWRFDGSTGWEIVSQHTCEIRKMK